MNSTTNNSIRLLFTTAVSMTWAFFVMPCRADDAFDSTPADHAAELSNPQAIFDAADENDPHEGQPVYSEIEVIRERYENRRVKIEREVTLDADGNYVNHGTWKMWDPTGRPLAEGQYHLGRREGVWTRWHDRDDNASLREHPFNRFQAPFVSQATFRDGKMNGDWIIFDRNQEKCCQITLQNGMRQGPMTLWLPGDKVFRQSIYENGVPTGDVLQLSNRGKLEKVATYLSGRRAVTKVSHFAGSKEKKTEAQYLDPKLTVKTADDFWEAKLAEFDAVGSEQRHGPWRSWYPNGQPQMEGSYAYDTEVGVFTWWHANGQKAVAGQYTEGLQHGQWVWWHPNGQKATIGGFAQGEQDGTWRRWNSDGQLDDQIAYDDPQHDRAQPEEEPMPMVAAPANELDGVETASRPQFPALPWMRNN